MLLGKACLRSAGFPTGCIPVESAVDWRMTANAQPARVLRKLAIDGRHDLIAAIRNREISAFAAGCLMGYCSRRVVKNAEDGRHKRRLFREAALLKGEK
jgi:hypothetical protein